MKNTVVKRRSLRVAAGLTAAAIILSMAACSGGSGSSSAGTSVSSAAAANASGKKWAGKTLTVCSWGGAIQAAQKKTIFDTFAEKYGCTIK